MKFFVSQQHLQEVITYCQHQYPFEACGILSGTFDRNHYIVKRMWKLRNELSSTSRFYVSEQEVEKTFHAIKQLNETILFVFHSHPSAPAVPSYEDVKHHIDPQIGMMIISLANTKPDVQCYTIENDGYKHCDWLTNSS
ncbi:M67 family metallopeptidase [Bacillus sp. FJAT-50079]|uniref:M67 family metallopeptidase n=1 Tax=Bacillus sp. FJAT-50079 TaxID=2833577 RepID=UPI001BCA3E68|nr:M67 family metallopeptidase [Bacillus sp. FJAT-50079]MBS4206953.1 M67 family metallopeptidase [Bacillus sp. FJAT-50079]